MDPMDRNDIHENALPGVHQANGVAQASFIIKHSDRYDGMVRTWRTQCLNNRATYGMLCALNARYLEVKANVG